MGTMRLTPAQWTAVQALANFEQVRTVFQRVGLGEPAGIDASGNPSSSPAFWIFDDPRIGSNWRIRISGGVFLQEWDAIVGGSQVRELSLAQAIAAFTD